MKPIIIGITKDGKVDMTLGEFRTHMEAAYWQGYQDNPASISALSGSGKWWETQPYFTGTDSTNKEGDTACSCANAAVYTKAEA